MAKNYIVDNLLCFLNSAKGDYSNEVLFDVIHSFYSIEDIKDSKDVLADLLKKDAEVRRAPNKKKKDIVIYLNYSMN